MAADIPFKEENAYGKTRTPEFITKFPNNCAPALEHGDFYICESVAIMRYLCRAFPDKAGKFYSEDPKAAAKIDQVCDMINTGVCALIPKACYPTLGFPTYAGDVASMDETKEYTALAQKEAGEALKEYLEYKVVGVMLANTKYLMSDTPTIADFRLAPMLSQVKVNFALPEKLEEYLTAMDEIPGYFDALKPVHEYNSQFWKS